VIPTRGAWVWAVVPASSGSTGPRQAVYKVKVRDLARRRTATHKLWDVRRYGGPNYHVDESELFAEREDAARHAVCRALSWVPQ